MSHKYLIWVFSGNHLTLILSYLKSASSNLSNYKILFKEYIFLNVGIKMPYLSIFRVFKNYCHIWNQHPKTFKFLKMLKFGTKMPYLGIFLTGISKDYRHFWNQHPRICLNGKFLEITKTSNLGPNALFGYFWVGIGKQYCHIWNKHPKFFQLQNFVTNSASKMSDLCIFGREFENISVIFRTDSSNLPRCKVWCKNKNF